MPDVSVIVDAGKATAAAPLGPALGPLGVNIGEVVKQINDKTKSFEGVKIPVKISVDPKTKNFEVSVGSPPMSALIKKELKIEAGAKNPKTETVGNLTIAQVKKIAEMKIDSLASYKIKKAMSEVIGTCNSMGVFVEGLKAVDAQRKLESGEFGEF